VASATASALASALMSTTAAASAPPSSTVAADAQALALAVARPGDGGASEGDGGVAAEPEPPPPCPAEMAHVGRFCIDRYEAHLVVVAPDGKEAPHPHFSRPPEGVAVQARSAPNVFPQAYISRVEAKAACQAAGKRLCHWLEWRRACQGRRWLRYPYSNAARRGACNVGKDHLLPALFGHDAGAWKYEDHFNSPQLSQEPGFLARTGAHPECESPDGVFDMVGNLHEWVADMVTESFVERIEKEPVSRNDQPWVVGNGMFLGGFYSTTNEHGPGCHFTTMAHEPSYHDYSTGFRCCATARKPPKNKPAAKTTTQSKTKARSR